LLSCVVAPPVLLRCPVLLLFWIKAQKRQRPAQGRTSEAAKTDCPVLFPEAAKTDCPVLLLCCCRR